MTSLRVAASTVMSGCSGGACCACAPFGSAHMKQAQSAKAKKVFRRIITYGLLKLLTAVFTTGLAWG